MTIPLSSSNTAEGTLSKTSVVFTSANWNVPQTVTVSGVADGVRDGDIAYSILIGPATSTDPDYAGSEPADLAVVNLDNSGAGFLYWTDTVNDVIKRSALDGSNAQPVGDTDVCTGRMIC